MRIGEVVVLVEGAAVAAERNARWVSFDQEEGEAQLRLHAL